MKLCALDLGPPTESFALATKVEEAGYHRFWVAEHQPQPHPLLQVALAAGVTEKIRVGTAAMLFHFYPATRMALDVRFLENCYPGRIDAGICAGRITDPTLELEYLDGLDDRAHFARYQERVALFVQRVGRGAGAPEIWSMGNGLNAAGLAALHGLNLGYSLFHQGSPDNPSTAERYRARFAPAIAGAKPCLAVAVAGVCAETDAAARQIADLHVNPFIRLSVVGSPTTCRDQLAAIQERYRADEIVFADRCERFEDRVASYRLLREACP